MCIPVTKNPTRNPESRAAIARGSSFPKSARVPVTKRICRLDERSVFPKAKSDKVRPLQLCVIRQGVLNGASNDFLKITSRDLS